MNSKFEAVMDALVDPDGPGAAVGVRHGDEAPYLAGFGLADVEWGNAITTDTVFRIGSITKQFTAAAIMLLVEDGKLLPSGRTQWGWQLSGTSMMTERSGMETVLISSMTSMGSERNTAPVGAALAS